MARYKLTLAYDGKNFFGSQRQANKRTVQGELEKALATLGWTGRSILMAGRTDTGVHAAAQVASVDLDWSHTDENLIRALNSSLPDDMSVQAAEELRVKFHPRFDAISRRYRYRLFCQPHRDPIREQFAWRLWPSVDGDSLADAARLFLGKHDFFAFGSPTTPKGTTVRTVMDTQWTQTSEDEWRFEVQADAFLYRMVRRMVFIQVAIAQGKIPVEIIAHSLEKRASAGQPSEFPSGLAPAHGLMLINVEYKT